MKTFQDYGIDTRGKTSGEIKTTCEKCSHTRKKKTDPCLAVNLDKKTWFCHHCEWSGALSNGNGRNGSGQKFTSKSKTVKKPEYSTTGGLSEKARAWFYERGLTDKVLERNEITSCLEWMPQTEREEKCIRFPYRKNGVVNIKFRDGNKNFKMVKDAERTLYGHDDIQGDTLIWTEGEIDKLSVEVAGIASCVSVPCGAADKLDFLQSCEERLEPIKNHILALDNDGPGKKLEAELIRRLGPEKCKLVTWPEGCKDANDVLVKHGAGKLKECIEKAKPCPIKGLFDVDDIQEKILALYDNGLSGGVNVGWPSLVKYYSVRPGEWTLITGIPSHGKSEFLDALLINLAESQGWHFGVCSPENQPLELHASKLLEKHIGKPFRKGGIARMDSKELLSGIGWLDEHFTFVLPDEKDLTVDGILSLAKSLVFRKGIKGLVIDPWNELDHSRPSNLTETEYISQSLTKIRRFARTHGVHVWLIAHPTKLIKNSSGIIRFPVLTMSAGLRTGETRRIAV
ncbi:MAG: toprim domain-containing protein [Nitrospinae bacterium]|nr:toprim domain-containing protein [Nitrospinota bacterium]